MMSCSGSWRSTSARPPPSDMAFKLRGFRQFPRYVSAGERRLRAGRALAKLTRKGQELAPIVIDGRTIATTFWGEAWCDNLERYSDFANRLGRGRTYLRNGLVLDLQLAAGVVTARVSGTRSLSREDHRERGTQVPVAGDLRGRGRRHRLGHRAPAGPALAERDGTAVRERHGTLSRAVRDPDELFLSGCRRDVQTRRSGTSTASALGSNREPALLFTLRRVKQEDLVSRAGTGSDLARRRPKDTRRKTLDESSLGEVFGLDIAPSRKGHV